MRPKRRTLAQAKEASATAGLGAHVKQSSLGAVGNFARGLLVKGKYSRGSRSGGTYKFGDFTRGVFTSATGDQVVAEHASDVARPALIPRLALCGAHS